MEPRRYPMATINQGILTSLVPGVGLEPTRTKSGGF
jgi:hypothetical protein